VDQALGSTPCSAFIVRQSKLVSLSAPILSKTVVALDFRSSLRFPVSPQIGHIFPAFWSKPFDSAHLIDVIIFFSSEAELRDLFR